MPRPRKQRFCRRFDGDRVYKPRSIPLTDLPRIRLELGELEAMRLCDVEGLAQEEAGDRMGVSRGTVQRLLESGRAKVVRALLAPAALLIERGESDEDLRPGRAKPAGRTPDRTPGREKGAATEGTGEEMP